jgi:hypothetical protein
MYVLQDTLPYVNIYTNYAIVIVQILKMLQTRYRFLSELGAFGKSS